MRLPLSVLSPAAVAIALALAAPTASAFVINFDAIAAGTLVNAPISGVTFQLDNGHSPSVSNVAGPLNASPPNGLINTEAFELGTPAGNLSLTFANPVSNLSLSLTFENGNIGYEVFQGAVSTLGNLVFDGFPLDTNTLDLSAFTGVTAVRLTHTFPNDYYVIDNVSFDVTDVPEPATVALLGLGLLGLGINRRRKAS